MGGFERGVLAFFLLVVVGALVAELVQDYTPAKLSVLFFLLAWAPLLALHEAGHALAAWMCGWRVRRVVIGYGGALWRFRVGGVPVQVGRLPLGGFVQLAPRHLRQVRVRSAFIYFMGPGIELALVAAIALVVGPQTLLARSLSVPTIALQAFAVAALLGAGTNLLPRLARKDDALVGARTPSDGMGIILSFVWPRRVFEQQLRDADD